VPGFSNEPAQDLELFLVKGSRSRRGVSRLWGPKRLRALPATSLELDMLDYWRFWGSTPQSLDSPLPGLFNALN
jgi:hypothetical protein